MSHPLQWLFDVAVLGMFLLHRAEHKSGAPLRVKPATMVAFIAALLIGIAAGLIFTGTPFLRAE